MFIKDTYLQNNNSDLRMPGAGVAGSCVTLVPGLIQYVLITLVDRKVERKNLIFEFGI